MADTTQLPNSTSQDVPYPSFEILTGPQEGLIIPLKAGDQIIGRSQKQADIILDDTSISRQHAKITVGDGKVTLKDLKTRNGTFVNGARVKDNEERVLDHLNKIKIGIYILRLALRPLTADEMNKEELESNSGAKKESPSPKESTYVASAETPEKNIPEPQASETSSDSEEQTEEGLKSNLSDLEVDPDKKTDLIVPPYSPLPEGPVGIRLRGMFLIIGVLCSILGIIYLLYPHKKEVKDQSVSLSTNQASSPEVQKEIPDTSSEKKEEAKPMAPQGQLQVIPVVPSTPVKSEEIPVRSFNAFLDITSEPTLARVFFQGSDLGTTPIKSNIKVDAGQKYEVTAEFDLKDIHDKYQQRLSFVADARQEVVPLDFKADIGVITIQKLPQGVSFYMEGYYAYDKLKANPVKLTDIIYGKPIYVPYGTYVVELREKTQVGDSNSYVDEIRYHREYTLNDEKKTIEISVTDRDLQFFQAFLQSNPSQAAVYLDGQKLGETPYHGDLPLGKHELKFVHDGYLDTISDLDIRTNTPYEATIEMKASKVGDLILKAKAYQEEGELNEAIETLVEALKLEGSDLEKAKIHLLLGQCYYSLKNFEQAANYFDQAKTYPDFTNKALLGLSKIKFSTGDKNGGLALLVNLMLHTKDDPALANDASALFKQVSKSKSVIYINTDPEGAQVTINHEVASQTTPLILSDMVFGVYQIEIHLSGYQNMKLNEDIPVNEFVPLIYKLIPDNL